MRSRSVSSVYLDACVIIEAMEKNGGEDVRGIFLEAQNDKLLLVCSAVVLAEVGTNLADPDGRPPTDQVINFLSQTYFDLRSVTQTIGVLAHSLARQQSLKPMDAVHLATAVNAQVPVFVTYDKKLLRANGQLMLPNGPLLIMTPADFRSLRLGAQPLFR